MAGRRQSDELTDEQLRIAIGMRELRRGAAMQRFRDRLYGTGPVVLDMGQQDALEVVIGLGDARMGDVAAALRVDPSTATRAVARLEAAGLVERRRTEADARAVVVGPTPAGSALYDECVRTARAALADLFGRFTIEEQHLLADLLERLVGGLDDLMADQPGLPRASVSD